MGKKKSRIVKVPSHTRSAPDKSVKNNPSSGGNKPKTVPVKEHTRKSPKK
jgi:hypothetical protein